MSKNIPQVVTIAGSDSSGGAGIQADLKTFQERYVYGASIILAVTAQNTFGVQASYPIPHAMVEAQFESVFDDLDIKAMKTGMLFNASYIRLVAKQIQEHKDIPYILDPVMVAKGGAKLLSSAAVSDLIKYLIPLATLVTPNLPEAEVITDMQISTKEDMEKAAKVIKAQGAKNVLITGGHLEDSTSAETSDYLLLEDGSSKYFTSPRIKTRNTHGTGDTLSACIVAELAKGKTLVEAVSLAKDFIQAAIKDGIKVGHGHGPTNHWAYRKIEAQDV